MLEKSFDFNNLFVLDMANNHQGDTELGLEIIRQNGAVAKNHGVKTALKFQFRQLDSFIHKDFKTRMDLKYVNRFLSTRLDRASFEKFFNEVKAQGMLTMCTPFDEESVDVIEEMGFDILKVASCSAKDWPLLEKIATKNLPIVFSTGGLTVEDIDNLVSFSEHRGLDYAIMHCISIYPTPAEMCQLNQIAELKKRYPNVTIGWSTHEDPNDMDPLKVAYAMGGRMFERHVGIPTDKIKLNNYSSTPEQVHGWFSAFKKTVDLCGSVTRLPSPKEEVESLEALQRGTYLKSDKKAGEALTIDDVYFAIPFQNNQLPSGKFKKGTVLKADLKKDEPVFLSSINLPENPDEQIIQTALHEVKAMLNEARVPLTSDFRVEYSHHYGIKNFREVGAILIDLINREYCKKIIIQLPNQKHPLHFHKRKEETFYVLSGVLHLTVDGQKRTLHPGEKALIQPGVWHSFSTETGTIFEEISTTHYNDDSFYKDKEINKMKREERKTVVDHWGRFLLNKEARTQQLAQI